MLRVGTRSIYRAVETKAISGSSRSSFYSKEAHPHSYLYSFRRNDYHTGVPCEGAGKGLGAGNQYKRHNIVKQIFIRKFNSTIEAPTLSILPPRQNVQAEGRVNKLTTPTAVVTIHAKSNNGSVLAGGDTIGAATKVSILPPRRDVQAEGRENEITTTADVTSHAGSNNGSVFTGGDAIGAATKVSIHPPRREGSNRSNLIPLVMLAYQKVVPDGKVDFADRLKLNLSSTKESIVQEKGRSTWCETWWTSLFQCPLTCQEFKSGTFLDEHLSVIASPIKETKEIDGKVYYSRKADAERACFARLLDSLNMSFLEDEIHRNPVWRYCHEQPYSLILSSEEYSMQHLGDELDIDGDQLSTERMTKSVVDQLSTERMPESVVEVLDEKTDEETLFEEGSRIYRESWKFHPTVCLANLFRAYNPRDLRASMIPTLVIYSRSRETPNKFEWTAVFESPVTGEKFPSGRLKGAEYHLTNDGIAYYSSKKAARDAAVGRAVDCFIHRKGWTSHEEGRYTFPDGFLDIDRYCCDEVFHSSSREKQEMIVGEFNPPEKKKENEGGKRPRDHISTGYQALLRAPMSGDCFKCESIDLDIDGEMVPYFTSSFDCPVTGQIFQSGTLLNMEEFGPFKSRAPPMKLIDGICYYSESKNAIHAAAGSAMDVLTATNFFSSFGRFDHKVVPRFCEEDPYISIGEQFLHQDEEGDDDFIIQNIPQAGGGINKDASKSTLEVILDAWADDSIFNKLSFPSQPDALRTALAWLEKLKSKKDVNSGASKYSRDVAVSLLQQTAITTFSCNAILKALANTYPNSDVAVDTQIEDVADQIIELMKVLSNETNPLPCAPDIETYNNYIQCLGATLLTDRAKKSEEILEKMISEKIDEYPTPNCGSFNAVMKHWLEVPGTESHRKIAALFSRMEMSISCPPNRKSFLIALKSLASSAIGLDPTNSSLFHPEVTSQWIERMHKYKEERGNCIEMKADAEIFNAALPLCTDHSEMESSLRPFFDTEFRPKLPESHPRRQDAINIERWFYSMEHRCQEEDEMQSAPDIHTLEAVIQAWIRTGSEEGIRNAEKWAIDASEGKTHLLITPRLETFYPILLAWSVAGSADAPFNIKSLLNKMDELGERIPELRPSSDLRSLLINAWKKHQDDNVGNPKAILDIAEESTEYLISLAESAEDLKSLGGEVFEMVIDMWGATTYNSAEEQSRIQSQLLAVVNQYNRLVGTQLVWDFDLENDHYHGDNSNQRNRANLELPEMSTAIDSLYSKLISTTLNIFGDDEKFRQNIIEEFFHEVEGHLLRRERYQASIISCGSTPLPFPDKLYKDALKWCNFLKDERRSGDAVRVAFQIIIDTASYQRQDQVTLVQANEIYSDGMAVIESVVDNPDEKRLIIRRVAEEIMSSNSKNEAFLKRTISAVNIDISDILAKDFIPLKEQRRTRKG
eukprot:CAMPEP_0194082978 /NCGR_PEP_ID=MMETSP0149-20130528/8349_1 /TAXON_ID=122233 /ORGANISM="Chaetoceros debilis, Strain MM31A-1" /LENGTH=1432 /DNA_ID=CAMNT_0038765265 /DNA_START=125 /DNA_END=4419 /DNA_ORIENTATION=+